MSVLKLFKLSIAGALAGALFAMASPQTALSGGQEVCICSDGGTSTYKCSEDHKSCEDGTEVCTIVCY